MQKWEYKQIYVVITPDDRYLMQHGSDILYGAQILEYMNSLGQDGWELVSVVERIGNERQGKGTTQTIREVFTAMTFGPMVTPQSQHKAATLGYSFYFKRSCE